jgi:hypothetical protein
VEAGKLMNIVRDNLKLLKEYYSLAGLKAGTEVESMTFAEIFEMRKVSENIVPLTVKIGGPEARNDIEYMLSIGVDKILAPMIESVYGLKNFVATMKELDRNKKASLAVNIETITAFNNFEIMVTSPYFIPIEQVTVGRTDLSSSMDLDADDAKICEITKQIINLAKVYGKKTSVGGKINHSNVVKIREVVKPDFINTRNVSIHGNSTNISEDIRAALLWEKTFYQYLSEKFPERRAFYNNLLKTIDERIGERFEAFAN